MSAVCPCCHLHPSDCRNDSDSYRRKILEAATVPDPNASVVMEPAKVIADLLDENILHGLDGQKCMCTLHDIGYNCRRALTPDSLHRKVSDLVRVAFLSGFDVVAISAACTGAIKQHAVKGQK